MEFRILGPLEVVGAAGVIPIASGKQRALLAVLVLEHGQPRRRSRLIDELWGDEPPPTADHALQVHLTGLRQRLGDAMVERVASGYRLRASDTTTDLARFERLVAEGQQASANDDHARAADRFHEALGLWRGDALADLDGESAVRAERTRLDELRQVVFERAIDAKLAAGGHLEAIPELRAAIEAEPLREGAYVRLMLASYRAGRQADALDVYQRARSVLRAALGVEPGPELEAMQRAVLAHDPALRPTSGTITPATSDAASGRRPASRAIREIVVTALDGPGLDVAIGSTIDLVRDGDRGAILTRLTEPDPDALETAVGALRDHRDRLRAQGIETRTAAFTSRDWGADIARLAARSSADLVVVGVTGLARAGGPEAADSGDLLGQAAADLALAIAPDRRPVDRRPVDAPIVVPFGGTAHDWAALELGAWLARARRTGLVVAGPFIQASTMSPGRARLLADACLVVQRMLGVDAAPRLVGSVGCGAHHGG